MKIKSLIGIAVLSLILTPNFIGVALGATCSSCIMLVETCTGKETSDTCPDGYYCCVPPCPEGTTEPNCLAGGIAPATGGVITPAKTTGGSSVSIPNPLKVNSIAELIDRLVNYLIGIATLLLPVAVIYSAYLFMTAGGDMEKVILGRKALTWTIVGYAIILVSKGITLIVANILQVK